MSIRLLSALLWLAVSAATPASAATLVGETFDLQIHTHLYLGLDILSESVIDPGVEYLMPMPRDSTMVFDFGPTSLRVYYEGNRYGVGFYRPFTFTQVTFSDIEFGRGIGRYAVSSTPSGHTPTIEHVRVAPHAILFEFRDSWGPGSSVTVDLFERPPLETPAPSSLALLLPAVLLASGLAARARAARRRKSC